MIAFIRARYTNTPASAVWSDTEAANWMNPTIPFSMAHYWRVSTFQQVDISSFIFPVVVLDDPRPCDRDKLVVSVLDAVEKDFHPDWDQFDRCIIFFGQATGAFGGAAVAVSLAMGASVVAMGRNGDSLAKLESGFGERVRTVRITGDAEKDAEELRRVSRGAIDAVFDIAPPAAAQSTHLKSCIMAVKRGGRISLMGGVYDDVPIPYHLLVHKDVTLKGKWMYGREEIKAVIRMVETGVLKVGNLGCAKIVGEFGFEDWQKALDTASEHAGWNSSVAMRPSGK